MQIVGLLKTKLYLWSVQKISRENIQTFLKERGNSEEWLEIINKGKGNLRSGRVGEGKEMRGMTVDIKPRPGSNAWVDRVNNYTHYD